MKPTQKARSFAINWHDIYANQKYSGSYPYSVHLQMVADTAIKFIALLPAELREKAICAAWLHDAIEDARKTYNDIKHIFGKEVAEVVYALTNEKGRNREERANAKYYEGIRANACAVFVKVCDRIANAEFSVKNKSRMAAMYASENEHFLASVGLPDSHPMAAYLIQTLANAQPCSN